MQLLLFVLLFVKIALGDNVIRLKDTNEFLEFSNNVNSGTDYSGTTVFLDCDLSLSGKTLEPIGDYSNDFNGTFDGQGYIISDLRINSTSQYTGLFGYSKGLTIRNVVLDFSCSITSTYSGYDNVYVGGIVGYCYSDSEECNTENSVNMADVTFNGTINYYPLLLGGIAGVLFSSIYDISVKNCANYGSITHSGTSEGSYIGGIVGKIDCSYSSYTRLYNCFNYGTITHNDTTTSDLYIGGIAGRSYYAYIGNSVSAGKIFSQNTPSEDSYIGSIVGYVSSDTHTSYCYYTSELSSFDIYGDGTPESESYVLRYDNTTFKLSGIVSVGSYTGNSLFGALNAYSDYYFLLDYSNWLLNKEKKIVKFNINSRASTITMDSQVILLPSLANEGTLWFDGWYNDSECTKPLESFEITEDKTLYGRFEENTNNYIITFDTRREGVSVAPITAQYLSDVQLPSDLIREHCSVSWWENKYGDNVGFNLIMPARNFTLYAVWKCTHITTVDDFIDFSKVVNSGKDDYSGTTVLLGSDLSLSGKTFESIGDDNYFLGVFDGQGHVFSGLRINSTSFFTGLFGYSDGLTIRNVVIDSSCSITNSFDGSNYVYVGGIIGDCYADSKECNIENSVNMADVTFSGDICSDYSCNLYLGGIAGVLFSTSYDISVKNCANYASVTHSGTSYNSYIGGFVGKLSDSDSNYKYIYNCVNYGTITHSGTTSYLYLGGIAGENYRIHIENCVSAGKITIQNTPSEDSSVGSIMGYVDIYTPINYCYYTSELSSFDIYGDGMPISTSYVLSYDSTTFKLGGTVSVGSYTGNSLVNAINAAADYYLLRDYSKWLLNKEKKTVKFNINSRASTITMDSQVILLPSLANEGTLWFDGWYNDVECTKPLETFEITADKTLYGKFEENTNKYTITFDTRREGVSVAPITAQFGTIVSLPSSLIKGHCSLAFWETEYGDYVGLSLIVPARNFTLYGVWKCTHIATVGDFIDFSKVVNSGEDDYNGTTVLLDSDLSLSGKTFESIGDDNYFLGVFDGQGHIISDLKMNTTSELTGLFGYSNGLTIRNVVLDSSCSITNSYNSYDDVYVGGIIGDCYAEGGQCNIENSVNMADVTFSGNIGSYLYLGGIAGLLDSTSNNINVKNCANYGSVTHSGISGDSYIGGIVGDLYGSSSCKKYLYNSFNYGTITHSGTSSDELNLGGIAGESSYAYIENCVSAGKINTQNTPSEDSSVGSIVGYVSYDTSINYCYYTSGVGVNEVYGDGTPTSATETPTSPSTVNSTLIAKLNNYASDNSTWNKWLLNTNNALVSFIINYGKGFDASSQIVILPNPANNNERTFSGWYTGANLTTLFTSNQVSSDTTLYGVFWGSSDYIVTFDANGGNVSVTSMIVTFNSSYGPLPTPTKEGHMFLGWFTDNNVSVKSETIASIAGNHTLHAQWEKTTNQVEIVFNTKDLSREEVEELVKKYTDANFTITKYDDSSDPDGARVTIRFANNEDAKEFVEVIKESSEMSNIKEIGFGPDYIPSISPMLCPTLFFNFILFAI